MERITAGELRVLSVIKIKSVTELEMSIKGGCHGRCSLRGVPEDGEEAPNYLKAAQEERVRIMYAGENLFEGIVREAGIEVRNGYEEVYMHLVTETVRMDREKKNRSFQDASMTSRQAAGRILKERGRERAGYGEGSERALGNPVIQYRETDWEFLCRLAGQLHADVYPDYRTGGPCFWFGMKNGAYRQMEKFSYIQAGIEGKYYREGGWAEGIAKSEFLYYTIKDDKDYEIGDRLLTPSGECVIYEKYAKLEGGSLIFTYKAGRSGCLRRAKKWADVQTGLELTGRVTGTDAEKVKLELYIDEGNDSGAYAWKWTPATGNLMYGMPEKGTQVRLSLGSVEAGEAYAVSCIRENGEQMPVIQERGLATAAGKRLDLHADRLMLSAAGGQALLSDGQGIVLSGSSGVEIAAEGRIRLEGERISANVPLEINMYRSPVRAGQKREDIQAKGSRSNPPTGGGESGFTMGNEFNNASETVVLCGTEFTMYSSFKDAPDDLAELEAEAEAQLNREIGLNVLGGLTIVGAVALGAGYAVSVVFTGGATLPAAPYVVSGLTAFVGGSAVMETAKVDKQNGKARSMLTYATNGLGGAIKGAAAGVAVCMVPYAAGELTMSLEAATLGTSFYLGTETLATMAMMAYGSVTLSNVVVQINDSIARISGKNLMAEAMGYPGYLTVKQVSEDGAASVLMDGLFSSGFQERGAMGVSRGQLLEWANWGDEVVESGSKANFDNEIPRSGADWNEYLKGKYGADNVHWNINSVDDIFSDPTRLKGYTADELQTILGNDWTRGVYGSNGGGWKLMNGDISIFYHPGGGKHGGSYYGISSGATGKIKVVNPETYIPLKGDKATVIYD